MRAEVYRAWQWLALPAAAWFALESSLQLAIGNPAAALTAAGMFALALGSVVAARNRAVALARPHI